MTDRPARVCTARRYTALTATATAAVLAAAAPAFAHVEVTAKDARALATDVRLEFMAESESTSAGITKLQVFLPDGMKPADVTYADGPKDWKLTREEKTFTVSGPAVATGKDAEFAVTIRQLPNTKSLVLKTLQTYSDGRIDRWIEREESTGHGHGNAAAPRLDLKPAAAGASPSATAKGTPSPSSSATTQAPGNTAGPDSDRKDTAAQQDDATSPLMPVALGALALAAVGGGIWWRRRSAATRH
ncbi:DUF1775 domain-containing protein [Streptomyces xantholiticus]|uniref:DUF1775 domain-containing protein n=1 Tax=Streptomyces xantholiticus TaxID=68285 RepID=UPI0019B70DCC|nr:DUF1775 domain-containing protein [Streptomyces xantholiticus]GGW71538.1 membrane protein [Streptomyces xantholiticus]